MNWGKAIVLIYILFAGFIGVLVYLMCRQRIDLVRDDYYQTEMAYQEQIDRVNRTAQLVHSPVIRFDASRQLIYLTRREESSTGGKLTFYRPSDRQQDLSISLQPGQATVSTTRLAQGFWRAQLSWLENGQEFYCEQTLTIP
jgi:hypothetical protein